jgi:uncharacterized protein (TIGR02266 family)
MSYGGQNRRKFQRQPISMQVKYRSLDSFFSDYALNISHGGIFIKTRRPLPRGSEVEVEFEVGEISRTFKTTGRVVRVIFPGEDEDEPAGMGVEFKPLSATDKALVDALWQELGHLGGGAEK